MCARPGVFEPFSSDGQKQGLDQQERDCKFTCKLLCCKCSFCHQVATKERLKSQLLSQLHKLELCKSCHKCLNCCYRSTCKGKTAPVLGEMRSPGFESKGSNSTQRGLHPPNLTRSPTVMSNYVNPQKHSHLLEALYQLVNKNAVEPVANQKSLGLYNWLFLVLKPNNRWRPILDLSTFLNTGSFKMETPETIRTSL